MALHYTREERTWRPPTTRNGTHSFRDDLESVWSRSFCMIIQKYTGLIDIALLDLCCHYSSQSLKESSHRH